VVGSTLQAAYQSVQRGRRQLDAIGAAIESAVANQRTLALDTPAGVATFSRFLAAKTQDINRVVAETAAGSRAGAATLGSPDPSYQVVGYGPKPQEPPPVPVPFPPINRRYGRRAGRAVRIRTKSSGRSIVRRSARDSGSLPAGDAVLYCGNDKYGLLHIEKEHGDQWDLIANSRWPTAGNWRYLADYAISATLAYPERVEYNQDNDTFAVYRKISLPDGTYIFTTRVVI
jgi:hypothetical protein